MKRLGIVLAVLTAVTILTCGTVLAKSAKTIDIPQVHVQQPITADGVFAIVNSKRVQAGLKPLVRDARLDSSAQIKAQDMVDNNYFAHINPNTGVNGYTLIPNGMCVYKGENISKNWHSNASVVSGWMGSKSHHDAILDARYDLSGIAVVGTHVVQHFCISK